MLEISYRVKEGEKLFKRIREATHGLKRQVTGEAAREQAIDALYEHLVRIGLDAAVESKEERNLGPGWWLVGSAKIANRNVDLIELQGWLVGSGDDNSPPVTKFGCFFVVEGEVEGLGDRLLAEGKRVKKSFWSKQVVDFRWKGKELAQMLNSDAELRSLLLSRQRPWKVQVVSFKEPRCVRISQKWSRWNLGDLILFFPAGYSSPAKAFPTIEEFEVYDRIAYHIRNITHAHP